MSVEALVELAGPRARRDAAIGPLTTYRVGGNATALVTLSSERDLHEVMAAVRASELPFVALGNGSNLLVEDGPHDVLVVALDGAFTELEWHDDGDVVIVRAGAGLDLPVASRRLAANGVTGFEWAVGVPGTFGGAVAMNAGGHGSDVASCVVEASLYTGGQLVTWSKERLDLGYRRSALDRSDLVVSVTLGLRRGDRAESEERVRDVVRWRRANQPGGANGGSVFRNPDGGHAARLIEEAGCKGLRLGSAQVSAKHANFFQADPGGRADDVYALIEQVRARVAARCGVVLESEHRFIGFGVTP